MNRCFRHHRAVPQLKARADGGQSIAGFASVFYDGSPETQYELWEGVVERIMPEAFSRAIVEDDVRGLFNHDINHILGRNKSQTMRLFVDAKGLGYEIDVDADNPIHQTVVSCLRRGDVDGSSFSFYATHEERIVEPDGLVVYQIRGVKLFDVGPVAFPAYEGTTAEVRSAHVAARKAAEENFRRADPNAIARMRQRLSLRARAVDLDA